MMKGISNEDASLAGRLGLHKLTWVYFIASHIR